MTSTNKLFAEHKNRIKYPKSNLLIPSTWVLEVCLGTITSLAIQIHSVPQKKYFITYTKRIRINDSPDGLKRPLLEIQNLLESEHPTNFNESNHPHFGIIYLSMRRVNLVKQSPQELSVIGIIFSRSFAVSVRL